jgi:hypothetical protein
MLVLRFGQRPPAAPQAAGTSIHPDAVTVASSEATRLFAGSGQRSCHWSGLPATAASSRPAAATRAASVAWHEA